MTLTDAILRHDLQRVTSFIERGVDIDEFDDYGYTPLIEAAIANDTAISALLLEKGALVNLADMAGNTALHWAVENRNIELCDLLLKHKANPNAFNLAGQPLLAKAILRDYGDVKHLLYKYGANLKFAQDFINAKLLGHRFQLQDTVYIVDPKRTFIEIEFAGFYLEFTLAVILQSLGRYRNNFAARHLRHFFDHINIIIKAFQTADELLRYQQYQINIKDYQQRIHALYKNDLLIIPFSYEGHAVGAVKYGNWFAICDRGQRADKHGSVNIYKIKNEKIFDHQFLDFLFYEKLSSDFMDYEIYDVLGLQKLADLPLPRQVTGNCSWANMEALIPTLLFMFAVNESDQKVLNIQAEKQAAINFYYDWLEWDKDIALHECIKSFEYSTPEEKASKAQILATVLFQGLKYNQQHDIERAQKMMPVLNHPQYRYVIKAFIKTYGPYQHEDETAHNFMRLIQLFDVE